MKTDKPKKIVIFGTGVASLASALELTSVPDWQSKYDITMYQLGWRCGGKTTTGRGLNDRIEEVGIHIFQGWYENAFKVVQLLYGEIEKDNLNPSSPFKKWTDAFGWENSTLLTEYADNKWLNWPIIFPNNDRLPGDGQQDSLRDLINKIVALALETIAGSPYGKKGCLPTWIANLLHASNGPSSSAPNGSLFTGKTDRPAWWADLEKEVKSTEKKAADSFGLQCIQYVDHLLEDMQKAATHDQKLEAVEKVAVLFEEFIIWVDEIFGSQIPTVPALRRIKTMLEFAVVTTIGILRDVVDIKAEKLDFDRINNLDFREWLGKHGASQMLLDSAPVRFLYTGTFANGVNQIEAGTALHFLALSVGYKGAFVWKFKAGTGDTLVMPFYLVLKNRGVKFKFFHQLQKIKHSDSGKIERIELAEQVKLREGLQEYDPRSTVDGMYVWPAKPIYDQIDPTQAAELIAGEVNLESAWSNWKNYRNYSLTEGVDFDEIILGVPIEVLRGSKGVCSEIIAQQASWQKMTETLITTATQAAQTWIYPSLEEMGMNMPSWGLNPAKGASPNLVVYANPMYSWIDVSSIIPFERWPASNAPKSLLYLCGSLPQPKEVPLEIPNYPEAQLRIVKQNSQLWLQSQLAWFFPLVANPPEFPAGIKLEVLWSEVKKANDDQKLSEQFYRANVEPSDRWTLSLPNTSKYRLEVDGSGYSNLYLAGDWVKMEINVGYTDGAMTSGLRAAQALMKKDAIAPINQYSNFQISL